MPPSHSAYTYLMPLFYFKCWTSSLRILKDVKIRTISQDELFSIEENTLTILNELETQAISYAFERKAESGELLNQTYDIFQRLVTTLRLLNPGPLYTKVLFVVGPDSSVRPMWKSKGIPPHPDFYILKEEDVEQFRKIVAKLDHISALKGGNKSLDVALRFFEKSYEDDWETAIVSCWTALEALCFDGEKPREGAIGLTVKIAVPMLLGKNRKDRKQMKSFIAKAYKARNNIVHGKDRESKHDIQTVKQLQDYLRKSIVKLLD